MSDLLGSLSSAARALSAQSMGLAVVGQNLANVNTPGYARRVVDFAAVAPHDPWSAGDGVEVAGIRSARDLLVETRLGQEVSLESAQAALADGLAAIDAAFGAPGQSIDADLSAFFDAFAELADDPIASSSRQGALSQAVSLAAAFHDMAARLGDVRADADQRMRTAVDQVNALAQQVATLNAAIGTAGARDSAQLLQFRDDQLRAIETLSGLLDIHTIHRDDGGFDVTFGNGRPLVIGDNAVPLQVATVADGSAALRSQDLDVTSEATGGRIGGLQRLRDVLVPDYLARLDTLASTLVEQVNGLHTAGFDGTGEPALPFFTPLAGTSGAASAIAVNPALAADSRLIAAAGIASVGDNQTARAIAALRTARVLDNGSATFAEAYGTLAYRVGQDTAIARQQQESFAGVVREIRNLREAVSGVSLDEEAALMLKFQRAYEANARYFQSVDAAIDILMQMVGG
jgi:flagellar hook-associated protein 1 FlgK